MDENTRAKIMAELDELDYNYPLVHDNDITTHDIVEAKGLTVPIAYMRHAVSVAPDKWEMLQVVDKPGSQRWFWVLRRKG